MEAMKSTLRLAPARDRPPPASLRAAPLAHTRASVGPGEPREIELPEPPGALILRWIPVLAATGVAALLII